MQLTVNLPEPHTRQREIKDSLAVRKVVCAGRRGGKTVLGALAGVEQMLAGHRVLFASTTQDQVDTFWEAAKGWLQELIDARLIYKNETKRLLVMNSNGGRIKAKTAWNADTLRGDWGDFVVLDEFAQMHPDAWDSVVAPMMLDTNGTAWFISTPLRRNHFYAFYQRALTDETGRWAAFHFPSHDNPHLSEEALAEITADMSSEAYRQEILAEFLESEGQVYRNVKACMTAQPNDDPAVHKYHRKVMGVDWGKKNDYTVISVFCADCRRELDFHRMRYGSYELQREKLWSLHDAWDVTETWAESNSMGEPIIDALQAEGMTVEPFATTPSSKGPLIEAHVLAFERMEAQWLPVPIATSELEAYELSASPRTGRVSYSAPTGLHDDTVMARAIAWWGAQHRGQASAKLGQASGLYPSRNNGRSRGRARAKAGPRH